VVVVLRSLVVRYHDLLGRDVEVVPVCLLREIRRSICFHDHYCLPVTFG
jgi:hypothetical protein